MTTARVIKIEDEEIARFLADLEWPGDVRPPAFDVVLVDGSKILLRFVARAGAPAEHAADFASPGDSAWVMVTALATLAEAWVRRHGTDPGVYPYGIKGQIVRKLDLRTAAKWLYAVQLAAALAVSPPGL